jgi:hypothetical protein
VRVLTDRAWISPLFMVTFKVIAGIQQPLLAAESIETIKTINIASHATCRGWESVGGLILTQYSLISAGLLFFLRPKTRQRDMHSWLSSYKYISHLYIVLLGELDLFDVKVLVN